MAHVSKRRRALLEKLGKPGTSRTLEEALGLIKQVASAKFDETVEVAVNLGVDPRKSDQVVRGSTVLPHGTGKQVRVAVFADGADGEAARAAGADVVGFDDLAEQIKQGNINFDVAIATPASMRIVGQLGLGLAWLLNPSW